jgi:DnaJ-class molecular chaperone
LKIPAGTQSGRTFKVAGKGAPRLKASGNGDLLVKVKVVTPTGITDEEKALYEQLAEAGDRDIRAHIA